jgi:arylsulfatase A-like enzyme
MGPTRLARFALLVAGAAAAAAAAAPPNFVVVLVDDWGWGDLGANGFGAETPSLDRYAARGVRFTDFHANSVCTPTRSALQTGRLNMRMGVTGNFDVDSKGGLALGEVTVAQLLQSGANYSTSATGKCEGAAPRGARGRSESGKRGDGRASTRVDARRPPAQRKEHRELAAADDCLVDVAARLRSAQCGSSNGRTAAHRLPAATATSYIGRCACPLSYQRRSESFSTP